MVSFPLQTEIAKRLNTILAQIMPFLSQEVRPSLLFPLVLSESAQWPTGLIVVQAPTLFNPVDPAGTQGVYGALLQLSQGWGSHQRGSLLLLSLPEAREVGPDLQLQQ